MNIITILITIIAIFLPLIHGAVGAPARSYWVFWYYGDTGDRSCGNYCYLVFSLVGAIVLCICGCGCLRCYFIRKLYKSEKMESDMNTQQILDQWEHDIQISEQRQQQNQQHLQYPPLAHTHQHDSDTAPPPSYSTNTYNADLHKHALRQESNWSAYKAGKKFTQDNPPKEVLPPQEHLNHIKELGGVKAWKFIPESSILQLNIASVTNNHVLSFHAKLDAMMQTNYPLLDMEYSTSISNNNILSTINDYNNRKSIKCNNLTVNTSTLNMNNNDESCDNISPITTISTHTYNTSHSKINLLSAPNSKVDTNPNVIMDVEDVDRNSTPPPLPSYTPQSFALQPPTDSWFYYFEITILKNPNGDTTIAIGLATKPYPTFRLPGYNAHSVGYHSNEGRKFNNEGLTGTKYSEKWGEVDDVIGCGYYPSTGQVFFTKNGKNLGIACTGLFHIWFPTIGSDGVCSLKVNFGQKEFKYRLANGMSVAGIIPQNIINQNIEEESINQSIEEESIEA